MDAPRANRQVSKEDLSQSLRAAGLKATQPRLVVLQLLQELGGHRSADDLVAELQTRGTPLSRASVYNALAALFAHSLVMLTDVGPGRALYEPAGRWHHHFSCRRCGAIRDVTCSVGAKPCLNPEYVDGNVDEAQIIFRGVCGGCLRNSKGKKHSDKRS